MYQRNPSFEFQGSEDGSLPSVMDDINPYYYDQIGDFIESKGGRLASVNGLVLYDTLRWDPGIAPLTTFDFFANGISQQQSTLIAGATYKKQQIDVHPWVSNGRLNKGYEALLWSIQVRVQLVSSLDESIQTTGNAVGLTNVVGLIADEASATDPTKAGNIMRAFQEGTYFEFKINDTVMERGPGWRFPTVYGTGNYAALANAGVGSTPARDAIADGMINNGIGWCYQMPVMRHIPSMTTFNVGMAIQNPFSTASNLGFRVVVILEGIGIGPVTG